MRKSLLTLVLLFVFLSAYFQSLTASRAACLGKLTGKYNALDTKAKTGGREGALRNSFGPTNKIVFNPLNKYQVKQL